MKEGFQYRNTHPHGLKHTFLVCNLVFYHWCKIDSCVLLLILPTEHLCLMGSWEFSLLLPFYKEQNNNSPETAATWPPFWVTTL